MKDRMSLELAAGLKVIRTIWRHSIDNPITGATIQEVTGVDTRTVAEIVAVAVESGVPVASCGGGYYRWRNADDREQYFRREKERLVSLARKVSRAKKASTSEFSLFEQGG